MENRFISKLSVMPSGTIKLSHGLGSRKSAHAAILPPLSIVPNFKDSPTQDCDQYQLADDCPPPPSLRAGWGLLGNKPSMSRKSTVGLRERMCAVELEFGQAGCLFGTMTLPSDNPMAFEMMARYSSYLVNRFSVWLEDNYSSYNFARCGVWEYQKRGALHYHFLLGSDCMDALDLDDFRRKLAVFWMSALEAVEVESDVPFFEQKGATRDKSRLLKYEDLGQRFANVQVVEKSVSAYLSSYLSGSNHDNGKDKNGLRKKLFPVATWSQWNRKATKLFKKYSLECEQIIWAKDYDCWLDLKNILFASIDEAENTEILERQNPWWKSTTMISRYKGIKIIEIANEYLEMVRLSGICSTFKDVFKFIPKRTATRDYELEANMHSLRFEEYLAKKEAANNFAVPMFWDIYNLYKMTINCARIMETEKHLTRFKSARQLNLIKEQKHGLQNSRLPVFLW